MKHRAAPFLPDRAHAIFFGELEQPVNQRVDLAAEDSFITCRLRSRRFRWYWLPNP